MNIGGVDGTRTRDPRRDRPGVKRASMRVSGRFVFQKPAKTCRSCPGNASRIPTNDPRPAPVPLPKIGDLHDAWYRPRQVIPEGLTGPNAPEVLGGSTRRRVGQGRSSSGGFECRPGGGFAGSRWKEKRAAESRFASHFELCDDHTCGATRRCRSRFLTIQAPPRRRGLVKGQPVLIALRYGGPAEVQPCLGALPLLLAVVCQRTNLAARPRFDGWAR